MSIMRKSRTGRCRPAEFVAAPAKAHRRLWLPLGGVVALAVGLAGCASTFADLPPQLGGLPAGTPERAAVTPAYPAVHDMPPPRPNTVLTPEEQKKAEAELAAIRARQQKQAAAAQKSQPPQ
jgi:hypothetical protein